MSENKTQPTSTRPEAVIAAVPHERRKREAETLLELMKKITGLKPVVWGDSLIGFGNYHYKYKSGREGDWFLTGFSPRKAAMSIYIMPGFKQYGDLLSRLGPHKHSVSCLYITNLAKVDLAVLEEIIRDSVRRMKEIYSVEN